MIHNLGLESGRGRRCIAAELGLSFHEILSWVDVSHNYTVNLAGNYVVIGLHQLHDEFVLRN